MQPFSRTTPRPKGIDDILADNTRLQTGYREASSQLGSLKGQRDQLMAKPGVHQIMNRAAVRVPTYTGDPGNAQALRVVDARIAEADKQVQSFRPQFQAQALRAREFAAGMRANNALRSVGAAPVSSASAIPDFSNVTTRVTATNRGPVGAGLGAGAPTPAGGASANPNAVAGTFNGRTITRGEADRIAARMPTANGMPVFGPNGSYAFDAGGGPRAARPVGLAPTAPVSAAPMVRAPTADPYAIREAERRRAEVLSDIDSQLFAARGRTNTRSARDMVANLIATKAGLANAGVDTAVDVAGGDRGANLAAGTTNAQLAAQRQLADAENATSRDVARLNAGTDILKTRIATRPQQPVANDEGILGRIDDNGVFAPIVDAQGRPQRAPRNRESGLTDADVLKAYTEAYNGIAGGVGTADDKTAGIEQLNNSPIGQLYAARIGQQGEQPPVPGARRGNDGEWYVTNDDGSFSRVKQ